MPKHFFKRHLGNKVPFVNYSKGNAAFFRAGSATYLVNENPIVTNSPLTITGWFLAPSGIGGTKPIFWVGDKDTPNDYHGCWLTSTGIFQITTINAAVTQGFVQIAGTWNDNLWHFFAATFTSNISRNARLDDTVGTENTTNVVRTANYDRTAIGALLDSTPVYGQSITIDNVSVWNSALTNDELTWLKDHANSTIYYDLQSRQGEANAPDTINLVGFWSLDERHGLRKDLSPSRLDLAQVRGTGLSDFNDTVIAVPGKFPRKVKLTHTITLNQVSSEVLDIVESSTEIFTLNQTAGFQVIIP